MDTSKKEELSAPLLTKKYKIWKDTGECDDDQWAEMVLNAMKEEVPLVEFKNVINRVPDNICDNRILHCALLANNPDKLEIVLEKCRGIIYLNDLNQTALHVLSELKDTDVENFLKCADILVAKGMDVNLRDNSGSTPIDIAIKCKNVDLIKFLLNVEDVDIDTHFKDVESRNRYITAESCSPREQIKKLNISTDGVKEFSANNQLYSFLSSNSEDQFIELCEDMDTIYCCNFFLEVAITRNLKKVTKYLYQRDLGNYRKMNVIRTAIYKMNADLFKDLLSYVKYDNSSCEIAILVNYMDDSKIRYQFLMSIYEVDRNFFTKKLLQYLFIENSDILADLFKLGLPLVTHMEINEPLYRHVSCDVLETYLDSCIKRKEKRRKNDSYVLNYTKFWLDENSNGQEKIKLSQEYEIMSLVANFLQYRNLLKHPMLAVLINEKWRKVSPFFYVNFALQITLFTLSLVFLWSYCHEKAKSIMLLIFLFILNIISSTSELLQLLVVPKKYLWEFENWVDMLINTLVFTMLFTESQETTTKMQISSVLVTAISFKILFLLGKFQIFARNSAMFQTVSLEYVKFFLFFSVLLIGFSFSFHFLFGFHQNSENGDLFQTWYLSIFRTLIMLTGELNSNDIDFSSNSFSTYIVFIVFIFSIVIILSNLLNGLAVSNVEKIKNDADILILLSRINFIYNIETNIYFGLNIIDVINRSLKNYLEKKTAVFTTYRKNYIVISEKCQCPASFLWYKNYFNRETHHHSCDYYYFTDMVSVDKKLLSNAKSIVFANGERKYTEEMELQKTVQIDNSQLKLDKIENGQLNIEKKLSALEQSMAARMEKLESMQDSILRLLHSNTTNNQ